MTMTRPARARSIFAAFAIAGATSAVSRDAAATPDFPDALTADLGLTTVPPCTICHQSLLGGKGTVTKPFGLYMRSRGLVEFDETSLKNAAAALQGEAPSDTDHAGEFLTALQAGTDPNAGIAASGDLPQYGCGALQIARRTSNGLAFTSSVVAGRLLTRRRPRG
ncbi:MAG: hypothetical protein ACHREM_12060 [Polyangiales bacterium]